MRSGWPVNTIAEEVEDLALGEAHAGIEVGEARHLGIGFGHLGDRADAPVARVREEVGHHLEALER